MDTTGKETGRQATSAPVSAKACPVAQRRQLIAVIEAAFLVAGRALTLEQLAHLFEAEARPAKAQIREAIADLARCCEGRSYELKEVAGGWRFEVRQQWVPWVRRLWPDKPPRYSQALLETLALIAYRQPVSRGEIESIRGVSVSSSTLRTLHDQQWIRVVGYRQVPGRPALYATTRRFLDHFSLDSLQQLPPLDELCAPDHDTSEESGCKLELPRLGDGSDGQGQSFIADSQEADNGRDSVPVNGTSRDAVDGGVDSATPLPAGGDADVHSLELDRKRS